MERAGRARPGWSSADGCVLLAPRTLLRARATYAGVLSTSSRDQTVLGAAVLRGGDVRGPLRRRQASPSRTARQRCALRCFRKAALRHGVPARVIHLHWLQTCTSSSCRAGRSSHLLNKPPASLRSCSACRARRRSPPAPASTSTATACRAATRCSCTPSSRWPACRRCGQRRCGKSYRRDCAACVSHSCWGCSALSA